MNIINKGKSIAIAPTFLNNGITYIEHKSSQNENSTFNGLTNAYKCTWQFGGAMMRVHCVTSLHENAFNGFILWFENLLNY